MILAAVTALLLQAVPLPAPKGTATASIGGVVVQSVTGEPLPNVQVTLARTDFNLGAFGAMVSTDTPPTEIALPGVLLETIKNMPAPPGSDAAREAAGFASLDTSDIDQVIVSPAGGISVVSKSVAPVTTDSQGRFRFDRVEPGTYRLILSANGYAKQERRAAGSVSLIAIAANESKRDIVVRMAPTGAISGRIADNRARPIAGTPVQLFRFSYDQIAERRTAVIAAAQTDDRGEYRFYFLSPGRYYLKAGNEDSLFQTVGNGGPGGPFQQQYFSPNRVAQNFALTYYPGTPDLSSANSIELLPGADLGGIDLFLGPQHNYRVRGRVIDAGTGQAPASANVFLTRQTTDDSIFSSSGFSPDALFNPTDGTFQIENVAPGSYSVSAQVSRPPNPRLDISAMSTAERTAYFEAMSAQQRTMPKGSVAIDVANADVDGVTIILGATARLSGRLRIAPEAANSKISLESLRAQLRLLTGNQTSALLSGSVKTDGSFTIEEVSAEPYKLTVIGLPPGAYVKTARLGETDILNAPMRISGSNSGNLDILISGSAGKIQGNVLDTGGQPAQAVSVVLIPDENRFRTELFRPATTDAQGQFVLEGIAPGNYKIAAWQTLEPFGFFDPDLLRQVDQNGKPVRITESSEVTVTIPAWP